MHVSFLVADVSSVNTSSDTTLSGAAHLVEAAAGLSVTCLILTGVSESADAEREDNTAYLLQQELARAAMKTTLSTAPGVAILSQLPVLHATSCTTNASPAAQVLIARLALSPTGPLDVTAVSLGDADDGSLSVPEIVQLLDDAPAVFAGMEPPRRRPRGRPRLRPKAPEPRNTRVTCIAGRLGPLTAASRELITRNSFSEATREAGFVPPCGAIYVHPAVRAKRVEVIQWSGETGARDECPALLAEFEL